MNGGAFLILWVVLVCSIVGTFIVRSRRFVPERTLGATALEPLSAQLQEFRGGARWPGGIGNNVTIPLIRLSLLADGVRLEQRYSVLNGVRQFFWEAAYTDLAEVQAVGRISLWTTGVRFRKRSSGEWVIFWTIQRDDVLTALEGQGLRVGRDPVRFKFMSPGE